MEERTGEGIVSSGDSKRNFLRNTMVNIFFIAYNVLSSLIMVPYLRRHLGDANYGMTAVARQFALYTTIITTVFTGTVFRFVTMRLAKNDFKGAGEYFNTQLRTTLVLILALVPVVGAVSYLTPTFLRIPHAQETNTQILFALIYLSFLINLMSNPFAIGAFARQRFDIKNSIEIVNQVVMYATWIVLFNVTSPSMWHVGLGYSAGAVFVLTLTSISFKKCLPEIQPTLEYFDRFKFGEMVSMGSWLMVSQTGALLYLSVDLFIINRMLGPVSVGKYSYILLLAMQIHTLASMMCNLFVPMAVANYARRDWAALTRTSARAVKYVSIGIAVPIGMFCGFSEPFLTRWLGPDMAWLTTLVWLLLPIDVINCGMEPLFAVNVATNRVAVPSTVTIIGGVLKVGLAIILMKYTNLGFYGVAIAGFVAFMLKNGLFTPIYSGRIMNAPSRVFFLALAPSVLVFAVVSLLGFAISHCFDLATYPKLVGVGLPMSAIVGLLIFRFVLNNDDRAFLKEVRAARKDNATST